MTIDNKQVKKLAQSQQQELRLIFHNSPLFPSVQ
jgi:hypothetical protein